MSEIEALPVIYSYTEFLVVLTSKKEKISNMNSDKQIQFTSKQCPICEAGSESRKWGTMFHGAYGTGSIKIILGEQPHLLGPAPITSEALPLVCTQCGYVQFFVNPEDFRDDKPSA